ncbi:ABC transporter substrate-binding protein [Imperialibacter roseus]|uniref:ABC transporter substrate-binding protein n=1 Tax=Imperialibacter roseus TaxID=1324217 RepID=A0ABZ0IU11_9BACT|nr:ABC transporter substrate-binding protein [Imperialibacter roseus]WOK08007.1 ABC transporter substrate-binding protein [Imperialibacter roseus]
MKHINLFSISAACLLLFSQCGPANTTSKSTENSTPDKEALKIVSIGGTLSEIVCALGSCDQVIAADKTSTRPKSLQTLPSVGYRTGIKAEGVVSLDADIVLAEEDHINAEVVTQLQSTALPIHVFKHELNVASTKKIIAEIGKIINKEQAAKELVATLEKDLLSLDSMISLTTTKPRMLFVYARGLGSLSICGKNTFAEELIKMAGAQFAVDEIFDYKPLTPEALVAANPDYILFFDSGLESLGGIEAALQIQGMMQTTAGEKEQILAMDGLWLSGFGPGVGKAAIQLATSIHPELAAHNVAESN